MCFRIAPFSLTLLSKFRTRPNVPTHWMCRFPLSSPRSMPMTKRTLHPLAYSTTLSHTSGEMFPDFEFTTVIEKSIGSPLDVSIRESTRSPETGSRFSTGGARGRPGPRPLVPPGLVDEEGEAGVVSWTGAEALGRCTDADDTGEFVPTAIPCCASEVSSSSMRRRWETRDGD